jgi:hypothetical protein
MAGSPQKTSPLDANALLASHDLVKRESDAEVAARLDREKDDASHRRRLEYGCMALIFVVAGFCVYTISADRQPDDSSRAAWTMLSTIVSAIAGYVAGRKNK